MITGIHHVTCIAGPAQENLDFYAGTLGMRLVKKSVNQDDVGTYHLFYADAEGRPGTDLTFFPWANMPAGQKGVGLNVEVPLAVPVGSLAYWAERLEAAGVELSPLETRFGERALPFSDPHGLELALVETADERPFTPWDASPAPAECQVRGLHAARLWERDLAGTAGFLAEVMGFDLIGEEDGWYRYGVEAGGSRQVVDVRALPDVRRGQWGVGSTHHVAWRVPDDASQLALQAALERAGRRPTPVIDRFWFRSVYFREPGGVLFEIATDGPGFAIDEKPAELGERLILPPWLEAQRAAIEAGLPELRRPSAAEAEARIRGLGD
ncbi:MAG: ring-cleaving dioxygenase [Candidatus Promineifilaceae bacterium]